MADGEAAKMSLRNLHTGEVLEAQFNPEELETSLGVAYNELAILGHSHKPLQYSQTENLETTVNLQFYSTWKNFDLPKARKFIWSLAHPRRGGSIQGGGTPDVLFNWPNYYTVVARVKTITSKGKQFQKSGAPVSESFAIKIHRISDFRITSEEVRVHGLGTPQ